MKLPTSYVFAASVLMVLTMAVLMGFDLNRRQELIRQAEENGRQAEIAKQKAVADLALLQFDLALRQYGRQQSRVQEMQEGFRQLPQSRHRLARGKR